MIRNADGTVTMTARHYENLRLRRQQLEMQVQWEERANEHTTRWAHEAFAEQRRLADRLTFVYGVARAHGATVEELAGS